MQKKFEDNYHQKAVTRNENTYILVFQLLSQMDLIYLTVGIKYLIQSTTHFMKFLLCSSDREKLLKFEAKGEEFAKILRSLEQFFQIVKGQNNC